MIVIKSIAFSNTPSNLLTHFPLSIFPKQIFFRQGKEIMRADKNVELISSVRKTVHEYNKIIII
jgi:hypothetical protein